MSKLQPAEPGDFLADFVSPHWSDDRLVRECVAGSEEAWAALLQKYQNLIYSIPIKRRLPPDEATEIFQAVCTDLLSELPKLRDPKALPSWLIKVTSNKCLRWQREQLRTAAGEIDEQNVSTDKLADSVLIEVEKEQRLREAVSRLSPRCAQLVHILFYEDPPRPYKEVAESLGIAVGSIGFIRSRCLDKLRAALEELGFK